MKNLYIACAVAGLCFLSSCSPRDFLTRRLARDLIAGAPAFNAPQQFWMRLGVLSNKDVTSPEYIVLQQRGWISATNAPCTPATAPPPCWDVVLTPVGVDTFRDLIPASSAPANYFSIPTARRKLVEVTGISKSANLADVDFTWEWSPMNEVGAALYAGNSQFTSTVEMKDYDDGWRVVDGDPKPAHQGLEDALKNAQPVH